MSHIKYHTSDRMRMCKLCGSHIVRNTWAIQFADIHVSPKIVDLHFHEGCLMRALGVARDDFALVDGGKWVRTHDR